MKRCAPLLTLLLAAACPSLEEQTHVSKLRVLGVRADPPELLLQADAGLPATTLTALAVTPDGPAQSVKFALCTQITGTPDPALDCPGDAGIDLPAEGPLAARLDLADPRILAFAAAQLDAGVLDAGGLELTLDQGVPLLIGFSASNGAQDSGGFATLTLRTPARGAADVNPEITALDVGDGGDVLAGQIVRLQPQTAPKDDPAKRYLFSFFATAGSIDSLHTTDTTGSGQSEPTWVQWTAPDAHDAGVRLWVVLRDGRGGTAWLEKQVQVR
jgi:hypothetical protein